jgi:hypothetical protein
MAQMSRLREKVFKFILQTRELSGETFGLSVSPYLVKYIDNPISCIPMGGACTKYLYAKLGAFSTFGLISS